MMMGKGLQKRFYKFFKKYIKIILLTNYNAQCTYIVYSFYSYDFMEVKIYRGP